MRRLTTTTTLIALITCVAGTASAVPALASTAATSSADRTVAAPAGGAQAKPKPRDNARPTATRLARTYFVLTRSRVIDENSTTNPTIVTLTCEPTGGSHPTPSAACRDLSARQGDFERSPGDTVCTMEYAPVTVSATGYWNRTPKQFRKTYSNACVMRTHTGDIFDF